jgi:hypothetical protein
MSEQTIVDFPAFGKPTKPTSAKTFSSELHPSLILVNQVEHILEFGL